MFINAVGPDWLFSCCALLLSLEGRQAPQLWFELTFLFKFYSEKRQLTLLSRTLNGLFFWVLACLSCSTPDFLLWCIMNAPAMKPLFWSASLFVTDVVCYPVVISAAAWSDFCLTRPRESWPSADALMNSNLFLPTSWYSLQLPAVC